MFNLIKQRFDVGTASALDIAQQESVVAQQRASIPPLEQILRQNIATLAVLIGRTPESVRIRGGSMSQLAIPPVTPGLPSDLIAPAPGHPRGRGAARVRQRQCAQRARRSSSRASR